MNRSAMQARLALAVVLGSTALLALPSIASAQKGKPACSASYLPFYKGQTFEYEWLAPAAIVGEGEEPAKPKGPQADWPSNLKIVVKDIKGGKKSATITLTESYRDHSVETKITCSESGFKISPESFFFAGEPGGAIGMTLKDFKQDQVGLLGPRDFRAGQVWTSYITANVERKPAPGHEGPTTTNGKIEIDRTLKLNGKESVESGMGEHRAFRLDVELGGRAAVEPSMDKWRELPPATISLWLAPGKGLVRVHNRYGHGWQLKAISYE